MPASRSAPRPARRRRLPAPPRRRAVWIVALVAAFGRDGLAGDWSADYKTPGSESKAAADLLAERFPARSPDTVDVVWQARGGATGAAATARDRPAPGRAPRGLPGHRRRCAGGGRGRLPGRHDRRRARAADRAARRRAGQRPARRSSHLADRASGDGVRVELGGNVVAERAAGRHLLGGRRPRHRGRRSSLLTFGSLVAAGLPLAAALFGLGISSALVGLLAAVIDVPDWAPAMSVMVGIGVGIDYALLIVTRFRAALAAGRSSRARRSPRRVATAGRSVLVAGTTVVISLLGLFLMGLTYLYGAALATIARRPRGHGGLADARAGAARRRRPADRPAAHPGPAPARAADRAAPRGALEPHRAAAPVGGRGRRRRGRCSRSPRRSPACGSASRTPATTAPARAPAQAYDLHRRAASAPARTGRCCSSPRDERPGAAAGAGRRDLRAVPGVAAVGAARASPRGGDAAVAAVIPTHLAAGPGDRRTSSRACATACCRTPAVPVHVGGTTASFIDQSDVDGGPAAAVHRRRRRPVVPAAARRLPLARDPAQGGGDEPALDRRRLRRRGAAGGGRLGGPARRHRHADAGAAVHPGDHVRRPLRALHGLRGVPAVARPRGVRGAAGTPARR